MGKYPNFPGENVKMISGLTHVETEITDIKPKEGKIFIFPS